MYYALRVEIPEEAAELLQALLDATGPLGMEVRDHTLKAPPGTPPLPEGRVQLLAYFEDDSQANEALREIHREFPEAPAEVSPLQEENWAETWKKHVRPVRVGRVWVGPSWELANAGDAPVKLVIDPGMAFGTGDHPTTTACLGELDRLMAGRPGCSVLDVGTGSGVLAIAAKKLGAGRVVGTEIDPMALRVARENADQNGVTDLELTDRPVERVSGTFDLVVANLFANLLCQLAPRLVARMAKGGRIVVAGILGPQGQEVLDAFEREGMRCEARRPSGEWVMLCLERG